MIFQTEKYSNITHVSAKDKGTGKEQNVVIQSSGGLSKEQIESMVQESEKHKETDQAKRDLIEERNRAEGGIHETEKQLDQFKDQLSQDKMDEIKTKIEELRGAIGDDNVDAAALREQWQSLQNMTMEVFAEAYKKNVGDQAPPAEETAEKKEEKKE